MDTRSPNCSTCNDPLDPDAPAPHAPEYRLWNTDLSIGVLLDYEDYVEAVKYRWNTQKPCKRHRRMGYMRRSKYIQGSRYRKEDGKRSQKTETIYLHVWVMERSGKPRPDGARLVDHDNNDIYDCRRQNLHWQTVTHNNANRKDMKAGTQKRVNGRFSSASS
jgi:hypothetical protein